MSADREEGPASRPNFLFLLPDQHRADWLPGNSELEIRAPFLEDLAARGTSFTNAICPSPLCAPSRACLALGTEYDDSGVASNKDNLPLDRPNYYRQLRDAGYSVAGVGKFDLAKGSSPWKLDGSSLLSEWGFTSGIDSEGKWAAILSAARIGGPAGPYMAHLHESGLMQAHIDDFQTHRHPHWTEDPLDRIPEAYGFTGPTPLPDAAYTDNWVAAQGLRVIRELPRDRPWHLVVNFPGPHEPLDVTESMLRSVAGRTVPPPHANPFGSPAEHAALRRNYLAMIENIDRLCQLLVDEVEARGERGRTVIIYASDHGEMLGDHRLWGKSTYYQASVAVPLIVAGPGIEAARTVDCLVALQDLAATMLDYGGAEPLPAAGSRSLRRVLSGEEAGTGRTSVFSGLGDWRLMFDGRYKAVVRRANTSLLFDLNEDPHEDADLSARESVRLNRLLDGWIDLATQEVAAIPSWFPTARAAVP